MAVKKKPTWRTVVRSAVVLLTLFGVFRANGMLQDMKIQDAKTHAVTAAKAGNAVETEKLMTEYPEFWHRKKLTVGELTRLVTSEKVTVTAIGLVDHSHSGSGVPEILVSTRDGALSYMPDTDRALLTEQVLIKQRERGFTAVSISPVAGIGNLVWNLVMGLVNLLLVLLVMAPAWSQLAQNLKSFKVVRNVSTRFSDVIGANEAKTALMGIMDFMDDPKAYAKLGARPARGVLLSGPPGTGKTMLAKALAGEANVPFIACSGSDFTSAFYGIGIMKVKRLFAKARRQGRCIIFIDEFDGVGRRTDSAAGPAATEFNRIINQFLVEMDGFDAQHRVIVIGATNLADNVDPALIRDGRFDRKITLSLPNAQEREELFKHYGAAISLDESVDFGKLARSTSGLAPAAIESLVNQAANRAAKERAAAVTMVHLMAAIETAFLGEVSSTKMTEDTRKRVADHEAGHAIVSTLLKHGKLEKVTILPRGKALGVTLSSQEEDVALMSAGDLRDRVRVLLGGLCAEQLTHGEGSTGPSDDLLRATEIARAYVCRYGLSGMLTTWTNEQLPFLAAQNAQVEAFLQERHRDTMEILEEHRDVLSALSTKLLQDDTVDGEAVRSMLFADTSDT